MLVIVRKDFFKMKNPSKMKGFSNMNKTIKEALAS